MSSSKPTSEKTLLVRTQDDAAEIFIIDAHFHMVANGLGRSATFELPVGVYTVLLRIGDRTEEKLAALYPDDPKSKTVEFGEQLQFYSPIPIAGNSRTHEYHFAAAYENSQAPLVSLGQGSSIFVMARDWSAQGGPREAAVPPVANPAEGLALRGLDGQVLIDFSTQAANNFAERADQDPWAAARVEVDPGAYRLSLALPNGERLEQALIASPGWQSQVYLLQTEYDIPPDTFRRADLANASVFITRGGYPPYGGNPTDLRTAELAKQGLMKSHTVLKQDVFEMLALKFEDPMVGIIGLHQFMRDPNYNSRLASTVVQNLRRLLGKHPDVEALAVKVGMGDAHYIFTAPPMVRASYDLLLDASAARPKCVPGDSLPAQIAGKLWGSGAWLGWRVSPEKGAASALTSAQGQALLDLADTLQPPEAAEGMFYGLPGEQSESGLTPKALAEMVRLLRIPASRVEEMLKQSRG